jgi:hypothetical protein
MTLEFDVKITDKDMYRFNMYHAYTGFHGIFGTLIGIAVIIIAFITQGEVDTMYTMLYYSFGVVFLFYTPVSLWLRSKRQILMSKVLQESLHYKVDDSGIHVTINEEHADLEWKMIYKMISTKSNLLIYSTRINAYVLPKKALGDSYAKIIAMATKKMEKYRLKVK